MTTLPEYLVVILKRVAEKENFINFTTGAGSGTNIGDNFLSELFTVVISGTQKQEDGEEIDAKLNLLCKLAPASAQRRKEFQSDLFFGRETYFYNTVAPAFLRFQQEKGLLGEDQFKAFPKCHEIVFDPENEIYVIVMEDLRPKGFTMWLKQHPTPASYCRLVVREMAKFHAISFAMKDQQPEKFEEYKKLDDLINFFVASPTKVQFYSNSYDRVIEALEKEEHKNIMREIQKNIPGYIASCLNKEAAARYGVISHGDSWNNNFIYQMNKEDSVENICFVDWQLIRYSSPVVDLLYYLFSSTDKKTRDEDIETLFREYHRQLSSNIRKMGSDPETLFPYEAFEEELKLCGNIGFIMAPIIIEISQVDAKDVTDLDELAEQVANGEKAISLIKGLSGNAQLAYRKRLNECFGDLVEHGYFQKL